MLLKIAAAGIVAVTACAAAPVRADAFMDQVKAEVIRYAGPQTDWRGPTSGPKLASNKHIAYMSTDEQNDASHAWGQALAEVGKKIGWTVTV
ncbi:MAG TPA: hypothetical protein VFH59_11995, partial [Frateuria sp.]|uniref:hypothetical protein n=1 Tax=Frateuria sp. TaxID=2211372 RepID=UPI002D7FBC9A